LARKVENGTGFKPEDPVFRRLPAGPDEASDQPFCVEFGKFVVGKDFGNLSFQILLFLQASGNVIKTFFLKTL
jgi:hypothetical protein